MIRKLPNKIMQIAGNARIAENATLVGEIEVCSEASIWYGAVLRGDVGAIRIGHRCAVEDNVTIHGHVTLGDDTVVGHNAVIHSCTIGKNCLVGMGAIVMSGAVIGEGSLIAAGCLVPEGAVIPPNSLVKGVPGRICGLLTQTQKSYVQNAPKEYAKFAQMQIPYWKEV